MTGQRAYTGGMRTSALMRRAAAILSRLPDLDARVIGAELDERALWLERARTDASGLTEDQRRALAAIDEPTGTG